MASTNEVLIKHDPFSSDHSIFFPQAPTQTLQIQPHLIPQNRYLVATTTVWSGASYLYTKDAVKILTAEERAERVQKKAETEEQKAQ